MREGTALYSAGRRRRRAVGLSVVFCLLPCVVLPLGTFVPVALAVGDPLVGEVLCWDVDGFSFWFVEGLGWDVYWLWKGRRDGKNGMRRNERICKKGKNKKS